MAAEWLYVGVILLFLCAVALGLSIPAHQRRHERKHGIRGRTIDQKIAQLPAERQERIKARADELIAEELSLAESTQAESSELGIRNCHK